MTSQSGSTVVKSVKPATQPSKAQVEELDDSGSSEEEEESEEEESEDENDNARRKPAAAPARPATAPKPTGRRQHIASAETDI